MKIKRSHSSDEERDLNMEVLLPDLHPEAKELAYEYISEDSTQQNTPDYYITETAEFVEVKAIVDRADVTRSAQWNRIIGNLQTHRDRHSDIGLVKGVYIINTPSDFKFTRDNAKLDFAIGQLIEAIRTGLSNVTIYGVSFSIRKIQDQGSSIHFSTTYGGSFDSSQIIHENITTQVKKANQQLSYMPPDKLVKRRTLLLVNEYRFGASGHHTDVIKALSLMLDDLLTYNNIDSIWVQHKVDDSKYSNRLVMTHNFIVNWCADNFIVSDMNLDLLQQWFYSFINLSDEHKEHALNILKTVLGDSKPAYTIFDDPDTREHMVGLGQWLFEQKRYDELEWLIKRFIDDPSITATAYDGKIIDYSENIKNGENYSHGISTPAGNMCWQLMYLAAAPSKTIVALDLIKNILASPMGKNLYIIDMLTYALNELAVRKSILEEQDSEHGTHYVTDFEEIMSKILEDYSRYPAIANELVRVFNSYSVTDNDLAERAIHKLKSAAEGGVLYIQYALYTPALDQDLFQAIFTTTIKDTDPAESSLRDGIAWQLFRILDAGNDTMENLKPWFKLFLDKAYSPEWGHVLEMFMKYMVTHDLPEVITWIEEYVNKLLSYSDIHQELTPHLWLDLDDLLLYIAQHAPEKLLGIVNNLYQIWMRGGFIGNPVHIFSLYKEIANIGMSKTIKEQLHIWHDEMRKLNPNIKELDWE